MPEPTLLDEIVAEAHRGCAAIMSNDATAMVINITRTLALRHLVLTAFLDARHSQLAEIEREIAATALDFIDNEIEVGGRKDIKEES